jgi:hypothetical protein
LVFADWYKDGNLKPAKRSVNVWQCWLLFRHHQSDRIGLALEEKKKEIEKRN